MKPERLVFVGAAIAVLAACSALRDYHAANPDFGSAMPPYERIQFASQFATPAERAKCEAAGGVIQQAGRLGWQHCVQSFADAGKVLDIYMDLWDKYPQYAEEMEGVHVLGFNVGTPMHLMLREKPLNTLADLQGLRIRSAVDYVNALAANGAEGVTMPMTETYPSLQRGVLDGVIAPYEALKSLSFAEVVDYYSELPHSRGAYPSRAMNGDVWASLPEDIQQVFEDNIDFWTRSTYDLAQAAEDGGRAYGEEQGVVFNAVDPAVIEEYSASFAEGAKATAEQLDSIGLPGSEILAKVRAGIE